MTRLELIKMKEALSKLGKTLSPNSNVFRQHKATLKGLNPMQFQAAIGLVLGDARIEINKNGTGALLKFEWGDRNKEYAFHVYDMFLDYCLTPPRQQVRINIHGNKVTTWCFQTLTHSDFLPLANIFLNNGKKVVVKGLIKDYLTSVGLAYWFIDDGGMLGSHSYGIQFHTQGFTNDEVDTMCNELSNKFNLKCRRYMHKNQPVINISADSYNLFISLTDAYIIDSIKAKVKPR